MFSVKLTSFDASKKIALIKEIKNLIPGTNLVQVNNFHDKFSFPRKRGTQAHSKINLCMYVFEPLKAF